MSNVAVEKIVQFDNCEIIENVGKNETVTTFNPEPATPSSLRGISAYKLPSPNDKTQTNNSNILEDIPPNLVYIIQTDDSSKLTNEEIFNLLPTLSNKQHPTETEHLEDDPQCSIPRNYRYRGFFLELEAYLDKMDERQRSIAKMRIMKLVYETKFGAVEEPRHVTHIPQQPDAAATSGGRTKRAYRKRSRDYEDDEEFDIAEIQLTLNQGKLQLIDEAETKNSKSRISRRFYHVYDGNERKLPFVSCKQCKMVYQYASQSDTSNILQHHCQGVRVAQSTSSLLMKFNKTTSQAAKTKSIPNVNTLSHFVRFEDDSDYDDDDQNDRRRLISTRTAQLSLPLPNSYDGGGVKLKRSIFKNACVEAAALIQNGQLHLVEQKNKTRLRHSDIWKDFYLVYHGQTPKQFVVCKRCGTVLVYRSEIGTSSLLKHKHKCTV